MRIPLATTLRNRTNDLSKGPRLLNAVVDTKKRVVKRPSLVASYGPVTAGAGLALFVRTTPGLGGSSEELIAISNEVLNTSPSVFANSTHDLTAATTTDATFAYTGYIPSIGLGAITPTTLNGVSIKSIDTHYELAIPTVFYTNITLDTSLPQSFFTSITNNQNGRTLDSVDATYLDLGVETLWTWQGSSGSNANMFTTNGQNLITLA